MNNIFNGSRTQTLAQELEITRSDLDRILEHSLNPAFNSASREVVRWDKDSLINLINANLAKEKEKLNPEKINVAYSRYLEWHKSREPYTLKGDALWEKIRNKDLIKDIINEKTGLTNSNISNVNEFLRTNKETILSELKLTTTPLTENKPLGNTGDITLNELINKGLEIVDSPLVKMIKEHVNINYVGASITSMILYRAVMKIFMKSAYGSNSIPDLALRAPSTRPREIALFMLMGAPAIVGALMGINYATGGGSKLIVNVVDNTGLEVKSSGSSSSSFFIFFNKLPSLLKIFLKYVVLSFIIIFITSVIGYNSNILSEVASQFNIYLAFFLKLYSILNFLVVWYFLLRIYVLKMFANNKKFLNPKDYPKFIKIELIELKEFTLKLTPIELAQIYKHYYFFIKIYSSIVLLCLITLVIASMY